MDTVVFVLLAIFGVAVVFYMERRRNQMNQEG